MVPENAKRAFNAVCSSSDLWAHPCTVVFAWKARNVGAISVASRGKRARGAAAALAENEMEAAGISFKAGAAVGLVVGLAAPVAAAFWPAIFGPAAPKVAEELSRPRAVGPLQRTWEGLKEFFTRPFTPGVCEKAASMPKPKPSWMNLTRDKLNQFIERGWTHRKVMDAFYRGRQEATINKANGNPATRYFHPKTGQYVVVDDITGDIIQFGAPGWAF